jgi:hypothetical protein
LQGKLASEKAARVAFETWLDEQQHALFRDKRKKWEEDLVFWEKLCENAAAVGGGG